MKSRLAVIAIVVVVIAGLSALLGKRHIEGYGDRVTQLTSEMIYELKPGTSFRVMATELENLGIIDSALQMRLYARLNTQARRIKSGEYQLKPGSTHNQLLQQFVDGKVIQRQITFVEGLRVADYLVALTNQEFIIQTLQDKTTVQIAKQLGIEGGQLEGWIYPDTYSYTKGTRDIDLLKRAHRKMKRVLEQAWVARQKNLPLRTAYEALILASIVEKETATPSERPEIAGVFTRRLQKGMRLQTDPTVIYGMGDAYKGNIRRSDLTRVTPYNTYRIKGLTPTPIANPGREAIEASLHPATGKALYFVAKGDGSHQFSATLAEHNRAVQKYQRSQRKKDYRSVPAMTPSKSES